GGIKNKTTKTFSGYISGWVWPSYIDPQIFAKTIIDVLMAKPPKDPNKPPKTLKDVIEELEPSSVRDVLLSTLRTVGDKLEAVQDDLAQWFDQSMERLSGVFKRRMQLVSFMLGI